MTSAAERQRQSRARLKEGIHIVSIPVDVGILDALIERGFLTYTAGVPDWPDFDKEEIKAAISTLLQSLDG